MEQLLFGLLMFIFLYLIFEVSCYVASSLWNLMLKTVFRGRRFLKLYATDISHRECL
ncbi:hypothetical protein SAMN05720759_10277 [Fibrobacter sp. UWB12]|nr:hypothetical protein SAMN05720759_10277 [Fibrobacter sp. UWB12]